MNLIKTSFDKHWAKCIRSGVTVSPEQHFKEGYNHGYEDCRNGAVKVDWGKWNEKEVEGAFNKIDTLEQRLKICEEALGFYGSPESWIIRDKHAWRKSSPRSHGDDENILDYHHPNRDWVGTVAVGGKRARQALAESAKIAAADE